MLLLAIAKVSEMLMLSRRCIGIGHLPRYKNLVLLFILAFKGTYGKSAWFDKSMLTN